MGKIFVTQSSMPPYEEYIEKIKPLWDSHLLTNMGEYHHVLERELAAYLDIPYVSLLVNGHISLELAIQMMGFPRGSEIITTPFTFISTTHAIVRNGLKPVFCDIKLDDYTIDESKIEALITEKTVAIIPVHVYGNICNVEKIEEIAQKYDLKVIYDAAHAFGEKLSGKGIANFGDVSIFSFHATKVFNTIEGGAVAFSEKKYYECLYNLKNFGIRGEELIVRVGANAKMNEFSAIMGLCNLNYVEKNIKLRKQKVMRYLSELSEEEHIILNRYRTDIKYNYGYFPIRFTGKDMRDNVYDCLKKEEIYTRKYFYPLTSDATCFKNKYRDLPLHHAREVSDTILVLPLYPELDEESIVHICHMIRKCIVQNSRGKA